MIYSICIYCGEVKKKPFERCKSCGKTPLNSNSDMAKSLILSTSLINEDGHVLKSKDDLLEISKEVAVGKYNFDQKHIDALIKEKELLDRSAIGVQWRFILFGSCFFILPIVAIILFFTN